jgi:hypothetical protein
VVGEKRRKGKRGLGDKRGWYVHDSATYEGSMELVSFSVQNYRSITKANRIEIGRSTVLVGPNNEGKSNVLRALVTAMEVLKTGSRPLNVSGVRVMLPFALRGSGAYKWVGDVFQSSGKPWNDSVKMEVKAKIGELVASNPGAALHAQKRTVIDNLVATLTEKLKNLPSS